MLEQMVQQEDAYVRARRCHSRWLEPGGDGCPSDQVLQEFYVNITQKVAKPPVSDVAAQIIADLSVWLVHPWANL